MASAPAKSRRQGHRRITRAAGDYAQRAGPQGLFDLFIRAVGVTPMTHTYSTADAFDDTWHHIAWVDANGEAALYIDGLRDATDFTYTKPVMDLDTTTIGGILRGAPSHFFSGAIDDVRIYNYILSEDEILEIMEPGDDSGADLKPGDVNGDAAFNISDPVAHLSFLFGSGDIADCFVVPDSDPAELTEAGLAMLDFNGDGGSNISDPVGALNRLFGGGDPHALGEDCARFAPSCESACQ